MDKRQFIAELRYFAGDEQIGYWDQVFSDEEIARVELAFQSGGQDIYIILTDKHLIVVETASPFDDISISRYQRKKLFCVTKNLKMHTHPSNPNARLRYQITSVTIEYEAGKVLEILRPVDRTTAATTTHFEEFVQEVEKWC